MTSSITKIKRLYRNAPISQKLFLAFSLVIIIPAILVSLLFIRTQETQVYKESMTSGQSHLARLHDQLRAQLEKIENASLTVLTQKSFIDYIHTNMQEDGLSLVKFKQNQYEQMHNLIQNHELVNELSFYVDNANLYEIWPEIYHYNRFWPQDYWVSLKDQGGAAFRLFSFIDGNDTLSYYRLVRLQGQQQYPTIMEVRSNHEEFFKTILDDIDHDFFTIIVDEKNTNHTIYNANHIFVDVVRDDLEQLLTTLHPELNKLQPTSDEIPIVIELNEKKYYAIYRYIAPLQAYIVNVSSDEILMKGPRNWYAVVLAVAFCMLILMMLLITFTTRHIFSRLDRVLYSMRQVRQGQLEAKINTGLTEKDTGDEIDEVAISYNKMLDEIKHLMLQVVDKQLIAKNAQLHSLHSQINSHFLYNALEAIRMRAEVNEQQEIANALVSLGSQLRYSMQWRSDTVLLSEELANIENYISFINFMTSGSFTLNVNLSDDILHYTIPKMCLQPIVENSVHFASPSGKPVQLDITFSQQEEHLLIHVKDNGIGIEPSSLTALQASLRNGDHIPIATSKHGLGLKNVHKRLQLHYGKPCGLTIDSKQHQYTCVTLTLPFENQTLGGW